MADGVGAGAGVAAVDSAVRVCGWVHRLETRTAVGQRHVDRIAAHRLDVFGKLGGGEAVAFDHVLGEDRAELIAVLFLAKLISDILRQLVERRVGRREEGIGAGTAQRIGHAGCFDQARKRAELRIVAQCRDHIVGLDRCLFRTGGATRGAAAALAALAAFAAEESWQGSFAGDLSAARKLGFGLDQKLAALNYIAAVGSLACAFNDLFKLLLLCAHLELIDAIGDLADVELGAGSGLEVLLTGGGV